MIFEVVALFAARAAGKLTAKITLALRLISSSMSSGKALAPALGPSLQQSNVLAIDVTMLTHPLAECVEKMLVGGRRLRAEEREAGGCDQTVRLLCARSDWPCRCRTADAALHALPLN
jgi:hypothetical protein